MGRVTVRRRVLRLAADGQRERLDVLAAEEPLLVRVGGRPVTLMMRTPGDDVELTHGFLLAEGVIRDREDVRSARYCAGVDDGRNTYNVLDVELAEGVQTPLTALGRDCAVASRCGVFSGAALDAVRTPSRTVDTLTVARTTVAGLAVTLREQLSPLGSTEGRSTAGLFATSGTPLVVRDDVNRTNAVNKALGWALLAGRIPLGATMLVVSGRASFELVRQAAMAGVELLAATSAPSSLAVDLAERQDMTLVGFLPEGGLNVYSGVDRIRT